jgi:hypothetical protein
MGVPRLSPLAALPGTGPPTMEVVVLLQPSSPQLLAGRAHPKAHQKPQQCMSTGAWDPLQPLPTATMQEEGRGVQRLSLQCTCLGPQAHLFNQQGPLQQGCQQVSKDKTQCTEV